MDEILYHYTMLLSGVQGIRHERNILRGMQFFLSCVFPEHYEKVLCYGFIPLRGLRLSKN